MASVQVQILRNGRTDFYGLPLAQGSIATVDREYAVNLVSTGFASWMNPADAYDGETNIRKPSETYVIYQSGVPWWIPAGDGGANGLSFTGTRGVFTLSAEAPIASAFNVLASGCYVYLPAGAGGLATGGWYWCVMTDGTNGEVFADVYSGTGEPAFVASPTALPNLSAGRITQVTSEIFGPSFTMPGGSMGPNGVSTYRVKWLTSSTGGSKSVRLRAGGSVSWFAAATTNSFNDQLIQATRGNMGTPGRQVGNRSGTSSGWDCGPSATAYAADVITVDTSIDVTMTVAAQIPANTDSIIMVPLQFTVQYGG